MAPIIPGGALLGASKALTPPKPPTIAAAGTGLLKGITPPKPPKVTLAAGLSQAGSALTNPSLTSGLSANAAATGAGNAPSPATTTGGTDLDSTYYNNIANYLFKTNNSINADQAAQTNDQVALQGALGQLAYAQPRDQLALEQKANAGGGLFSSVYGQNLGNLNQKFLTEQNADTTKYNGDIQALAAKIAALQGSIPLYNSSEAEASATRAAALAAKNPAAGEPAPAPAAAAAPAAAPVTLSPTLNQLGGALAAPGVAQQLAKGKAAKPAAKKNNNSNLGLFANLLK